MDPRSSDAAGTQSHGSLHTFHMVLMYMHMYINMKAVAMLYLDRNTVASHCFEPGCEARRLQ